MPAAQPPPSRRAAFIGRVPPWSLQSPLGTVPGITNGIQLVPPFAGSPSSSLILSTNVSPNALLRSASYPLPADTGSSGPLTAAAAPTEGDTQWRMYPGDEGTGSTALMAQWADGPDTAYVYSNDPANLGGITGEIMTIDGYLYPAGTYVFQFLDFSEIGYEMSVFETFPNFILRGCRSRNVLDAPGFINMQGFTNYLGLHYCDIGCESAAFCATQLATVSIDLAGFSGSCRVLRCYTSYGSTGIQPNCGGTQCETIENYVEKLTYSDVDETPAHLNGICLNGGENQWFCARNNVVISAFDENGAAVNQTDCLALFEDFGNYPGSGTNYDGSIGYVVEGNYVGGTGYSIYLNSSVGSEEDISNLAFTNNLVTTSQYSTGGSFGPLANPPSWGTQGNYQSNNLWADGPDAGTSFVT